MDIQIKLINQFSQYLHAQNVSYNTVKNYLADLRHFFEWYYLYLKSHKYDWKEVVDFIQLINKQVVSDYCNFLIVNKIPNKNVNRKLSSLRKFCSFAISQGWLTTNPAKKVSNFQKTIITESINFKILKEFKKSLQQDGATSITIKNYLNDIKQFLNWAENITFKI